MTTLIFVRHGQSLGNFHRRFLGHTDLDLSETGYIQAERTAEYIVSNYKVDKIYSSDLLRAYNTAKAVSNKVDIEIIKDKRLREIYAGDWENKSFDNLMQEYPEEYKMWRNDIGKAVCTNGESPKELLERVLPAVVEIAKKNDGKTVLIAAHATVIRTLETVWRGIDILDMQKIPWVSNASVSVVEYLNGDWSIKLSGEDSFLGELVSTLPPNV